MKIKNNKIIFLWEAIKPYKYWYLLMMQAPFANGIHMILYNYSIKLLIDVFLQNNQITLENAFLPIFYFIFSAIYLKLAWRLHDFSAYKSMPYIMQRVMDGVNNYVMSHSWLYFQNNFTGSIVSKVKGINDGAQKIHNAIEFQVSNPVILTIFTGTALAIVNLQLFLIILVFTILLAIVSFYFGSILNNIEQEKENSWHRIIGKIADNIANIFVILNFAKVDYENRNISKIYEKDYLPLALKWHKIDFIMCIITAIIYCVFIFILILYLIYLKNNNHITVGDIAYILSISFIFTDNAWRAINAIKDFARDIANFRASFTIMEVPIVSFDKKYCKDLII